MIVKDVTIFILDDLIYIARYGEQDWGLDLGNMLPGCHRILHEEGDLEVCYCDHDLCNNARVVKSANSAIRLITAVGFFLVWSLRSL